MRLYEFYGKSGKYYKGKGKSKILIYDGRDKIFVVLSRLSNNWMEKQNFDF